MLRAGGTRLERIVAERRPAVLARAGICRATDSEQQSCELADAKVTFCLGRRNGRAFWNGFVQRLPENGRIVHGHTLRNNESNRGQ